MKVLLMELTARDLTNRMVTEPVAATNWNLCCTLSKFRFQNHFPWHTSEYYPLVWSSGMWQ